MQNAIEAGYRPVLQELQQCTSIKQDQLSLLEVKDAMIFDSISGMQRPVQDQQLKRALINMDVNTIQNFSVLQEDIVQDSEIITPGSLAWHIAHFDKNFQKENLPQEWWNLKDSEQFSMRKEMGMLKSLDKEEIIIWGQRVERNLLWFILEFLKQGTYFPFEYKEMINEKGQRVWFDEKFQKAMLDCISPEERDGAVLNISKKIHDHLLENGKSTIFISPAGKSGNITDKGEEIEYEDTQILYSQVVKLSDGRRKIIGSTFRNDFTREENRELILRLTGKLLDRNAPDYEYVLNAAFDSTIIQSPQDLISLQKNVRLDLTSITGKNPNIAFQDPNEPSIVRTWQDMERDANNRDNLIDANAKAKELIRECIERIVSQEPSFLEFQKTVAATVLLLSRLFLYEERYNAEDLAEQVLPSGIREHGMPAKAPPTFGEILNKVNTLVGCPGKTKKIKGDPISQLLENNFDDNAVEDEICISIRCPFEIRDSETDKVIYKCLWELEKDEEVPSCCPDCGWKPGDAKIEYKNKKAVDINHIEDHQRHEGGMISSQIFTEEEEGKTQPSEEATKVIYLRPYVGTLRVLQENGLMGEAA